MAENPYGLALSRWSTHKLLIDLIGRNKRVLDVGCNEGYLGVHAGRSNQFFGLDQMEDAVAACRDVYQDAAVYDLDSLTRLPWEGTFDVIILADVLEHVRAPERVLRFLVAHYLSDHGTVLISLPNIANWMVRLRLLWGRFDPTDTGIMDRTHLHFYTYRTARQLVEGEGLVIARQLGGASVLGPVIKALPVLRGALATGIVLMASRHPAPTTLGELPT